MALDLQGLNFHPGVGVQDVIQSKFGCSVSPAVPGRAFFLVASFGRCKLKLSPVSVGFLLQATIGGVAEDFEVLPLSDRVFRFSVSLSGVGFHVVKLHSFECSLYKIYFHLWSNGGPHWFKEWKSFCSEEEASWSVQKKAAKASPSVLRSNLSYADVVRSSVLTGANRVPLDNHQKKKRSVFSRISFPDKNVHVHSSSKGKQPVGQFFQKGPSVELGRSLNFGSLASQPWLRENLSKSQHPGFCSRCLSEDHRREACRFSIKCWACRRGGHIASTCPGNSNSRSKEGGFTAANRVAASFDLPKANANATTSVQIIHCLGQISTILLADCATKGAYGGLLAR